MHETKEMVGTVGGMRFKEKKMRKKAIRCCGDKEGCKCKNLLGYIIGNKLVLKRYGRTIQVTTLGTDSAVTIVCEKCGTKNQIGVSTFWEIKK